jgi:hypothetical protein
VRGAVQLQPEYNFVSGAPNRTFDNQANGTAVGLLAGHHWLTAVRRLAYLNVREFLDSCRGM